MTREFRVGDDVIGLSAWWQSEPIVGRVLNTDMTPLGPRSNLLIDTKRNVHHPGLSYVEYCSLSPEFRTHLAILDAELTTHYSVRTEVHLSRILRFANTPPAKQQIGREKLLCDFVTGTGEVLSVILLNWLIYLMRLFVRGVDLILIGTIELIFGDVFRFYRLRFSLKKAIDQMRYVSRNTSFIDPGDTRNAVISASGELNVEKRKQRITDLKQEIKSLETEKSQISRSFLALAVAIAALIVSIITRK